jgi:hypothetical protein
MISHVSFIVFGLRGAVCLCPPAFASCIFHIGLPATNVIHKFRGRGLTIKPAIKPMLIPCRDPDCNADLVKRHQPLIRSRSKRRSSSIGRGEGGEAASLQKLKVVSFMSEAIWCSDSKLLMHVQRHSTVKAH